MAQRKKNTYKRQLISFNPNFRIDTANPQMGKTGTDVYKIYGVTDNKDNQSSISLSSGGLMSIYNDHSLQIVGGEKNDHARAAALHHEAHPVIGHAFGGVDMLDLLDGFASRFEFVEGLSLQ